MFRSLWLAALLLATPGQLSASTIVPGGNLINQTWILAGSPYIVQGDITIPGGSTLTVQAGVDVQFASTDGQGSGIDVNRIEMTVRGQLGINGTAVLPVTLHAQSGSDPSTWIGIVVDNLATSVQLSNVVLRHAAAGVRVSQIGNVTALDAVKLEGNNRDLTILPGGSAAMSGRIEAGSFIGNLTIPSPATLALNRNVGTLLQGNFTLNSGATYEAKLTNTSDYERLQVFGGVVLGGDLSIDASAFNGLGEQFVLIDNDDTDAVTGTFHDLGEGAIIFPNNIQFQISYQGGDGNDVVLTQTNLIGVEGPSPPPDPSRLQLIPNPSSRGGRIVFAAPAGSRAEVRIFDASGRLVRQLTSSVSGDRGGAIEWDGHDAEGRRLRSGSYFYELRVNGRSIGTRRAVLTR